MKHNMPKVPVRSSVFCCCGWIYVPTYSTDMAYHRCRCEELDGSAVRALGDRSRKLNNVRKGQSSDGWPKFISRASPCFGRHFNLLVKPLVPAAIAVVCTHSSFKALWNLKKKCHYNDIKSTNSTRGGARWPRGQCARRAITEAMQRLQKSSHKMGDQNVLYQAPCASEGTLSRWSQLHFQSLAHTPVSRRVDVRQAVGRKNNCRIFITTWWKTCCTDPT
jgi:hypothetical protein